MKVLIVRTAMPSHEGTYSIRATIAVCLVGRWFQQLPRLQFEGKKGLQTNYGRRREGAEQSFGQVAQWFSIK